MSIKLTILEQMTEVAHERGKMLAPLSDHLMLVDSGLDSLLMVILLARLEERLGINPFSNGEDIRLPVTIRDFIEIYENSGFSAVGV